MELHQRRALRLWDLENHEAWLAAQAGSGRHLAGYSALRGFRFRLGEPGAFSFCWDRSPREKHALSAYIARHVAAGWAPVADVGGLVCWRRPRLPGQAVPALRSAAETREMFNALVKERMFWSALVLLPVFHAWSRILAGKSPFLPFIDYLLLAGGLGYIALGAHTWIRLRARAA